MRTGSRAGAMGLLGGAAIALAAGVFLLWPRLESPRVGSGWSATPRPEGAASARRLERAQSAQFATAGQRLLEQKRLVLGWAALEGALRLDPANTLARKALDALESQAALAVGAERTALGEAAGRVESMLGVQGGEPLAVLALGLAEAARSADEELELLDRLEYLDHNRLQAVTSPGEAIKLVARLMLECGRTDDAKRLLESLAKQPSAAGVVDREAYWLLSRVHLARDEDDLADAALEKADGWGEGGAEPAPFVGSRQCGECHRTLTREQQHRSRHALTLALGGSLSQARLPAAPVPDPKIPGLSHRFTRQPSGRIDVESRARERVVKAVVDYAVGSGRHGVTMVARDQAGVERQLRVSYLGSIDGWGATKGIDMTTRENGELLGRPLPPETVSRCLHCHATWFRAVDLRVAGPRGPEALDHGIGCERCHGPGLNHVKAVQTGFAQSAIALGARTPAAARLASCYECHAADGTLKPSDPEFTRAQGTTFKYSRCYIASRDRFDCTTCHDPHQILDETAAHYESRCLTCHADGSAGATHAPTTCPVNPRSGCIACHMPKIDDHSRLSKHTDHHIRVHRD